MPRRVSVCTRAASVVSQSISIPTGLRLATRWEYRLEILTGELLGKSCTMMLHRPLQKLHKLISNAKDNAVGDGTHLVYGART